MFQPTLLHPGLQIQSVPPPDPTLHRWLQGATQTGEGAEEHNLPHFAAVTPCRGGWRRNTLSSAEDRRVISCAQGDERGCQGTAGHLPNSETTPGHLKTELYHLQALF